LYYNGKRFPLETSKQFSQTPKQFPVGEEQFFLYWHGETILVDIGVSVVGVSDVSVIDVDFSGIGVGVDVNVVSV